MFKKNFSDICAKKGLSPTSVCVAVGLSNAIYSRWTDESVPHETTRIKLANYLGVSVEDLFREDTTADSADTPADTTDPVDAEIARLFPLLKDEDKADVLRYIEFLRAKNGGK